MPFGPIFIKVTGEQDPLRGLLSEFAKTETLPDGWAMVAQVYQCRDVFSDTVEVDEYAITGMLVPAEKAVRIKAILEAI